MTTSVMLTVTPLGFWLHATWIPVVGWNIKSAAVLQIISYFLSMFLRGGARCIHHSNSSCSSYHYVRAVPCPKRVWWILHKIAGWIHNRVWTTQRSTPRLYQFHPSWSDTQLCCVALILKNPPKLLGRFFEDWRWFLSMRISLLEPAVHRCIFFGGMFCLFLGRYGSKSPLRLTWVPAWSCTHCHHPSYTSRQSSHRGW